MIHKILLGYDGSASATLALEFALDLARRYEAELHLVAVARPPDFGDEVESEAVIENSRRHYDKVLGTARAALAREPIKSRTQVMVGHPTEQLLRYADSHGIDHIVVGYRGHSLFERLLIGSVARQVMAYAKCAVTVVRRR